MEKALDENSADPNDDLALYRAERETACKLMDEHPEYYLGSLQIKTRGRWKGQPLFTERWALDEHILKAIGMLPNDVEWAFFVWEIHRGKVRSSWGEKADALLLLHDLVASWVRSGVIPGYKQYAIHKSPYPEIVWPDYGFIEPLRARDDARAKARHKHRLAREEENEGAVAFGKPLGNKGGHRGAVYETFKSPRRDRKKVRPRYELIGRELGEAARMAECSLEELTAPFPRGRLTPDGELRRAALADAVCALVEAGHRQTDIAKELSMNKSTVQRLYQSGLESKCTLSADVVYRDKTSDPQERSWGKVVPLKLSILGGHPRKDGQPSDDQTKGETQ